MDTRVSKTLKKGFVEMRDFHAVLGRLCFTVGALDYLRPLSLHGTPLRLGSSSGGSGSCPGQSLSPLRCIADNVNGEGGPVW